MKQNPFSYADDGRLIVNVLFEQKSEALHFRSVVFKNAAINSPNGDLKVSLSVEFAAGATLDEQILRIHYEKDEDSPAETPRESIATELFDTSPLFQYQRLEDARYFGSMYKADRAHLIDKGLCAKGAQFSKYDNDNNLLALSKEVHCWFDALSNVSDKMPFFKLQIKMVSQNPDPANDFRYRVTLSVRAYSSETARLLFPRLKDGSTTIDDTTAETFVYVTNPEEFGFCVGWKAVKIDKTWEWAPAVE